MAYPYNFLKLTFGGNIWNGLDQWSNGINFGKETENINITQQDLNGLAETFASHIREWFSSNQSYISNRSQLEWVKVAVIGADGKYVYDADVYDLETPVPGASIVNVAPQLTVVQTMETSRRRVPGRFARIYPPLNVPMLGNEPYITSNIANSMRNTFAKLIQDLNSQTGVMARENIRAIVASEKTNQHYFVQSVKVGNVIDTQRSRRNALTETYTEPAAIAQPVPLNTGDGGDDEPVMPPPVNPDDPGAGGGGNF